VLYNLAQNIWSDTLYVPYATVNKSSKLNSSQVTALLGYQASTRTTQTVLFIVFLVLGIAGFAVGVIGIIKCKQAQKIGDVTSERV
jgi:hypothetical protein